MNRHPDFGTEPQPSGPLLLTVDAVAAELSLSRRWVQRMIASGVLPVVRLGRSTRVARRDLEHYVEALRQGVA